MGATPGTTMGHLALHYREGDYELACLLLSDVGFTLVDNGPAPGRDGFATVVLDDTTNTFADNIFFLSKLDATQQALEDVIFAALGQGTDRRHPALTAYYEARRDHAERFAHFGIRFGTFEQLESALSALDRDCRPGAPLHGRVDIEKRIPPPGFSEAVDRRIAESPLFTGNEPPGPAKHWIQCRFVTDIVGFGLVGLGAEFELDYVFPDFHEGPVSFGRADASATRT